MASYSHLEDVEAGWAGKSSVNAEPSFEFAEKQVRLGFIRKVFGLLTLQLALTAGVTAAFVLSSPVKSYVASNPWTFWTAFAGGLVSILVLAISENARRKHPYNLMMLFVFTACESVLVGTVSAQYDTQVVLMAVIITAGVVFGLTMFTLQTKIDLTASSGILFSLLWTLVFAGLLQIFIRAAWLHIAIAAGGALLFSAYLVFDIQLLMGGGRMELSPDEYVLATLNLYLDVINLFLYILQLLNEVKSR